MFLSAKSLAIVSALIWGACMLMVGILNLASGTYGEEFLRMMSSLYPGFKFARTVGDTLVGTGYGLVDGAITGYLVAWLYNRIAVREAQR